MRTPTRESDPRALMGFANKNDRHATHLSPRELLFNGLHPASGLLRHLVVPVVTLLRADIDIHVSSPLAVGIRGTADYINLSMHISDLPEIGCSAENKTSLIVNRISLISSKFSKFFLDPLKSLK